MPETSLVKAVNESISFGFVRVLDIDVSFFHSFPFFVGRVLLLSFPFEMDFNPW